MLTIGWFQGRKCGRKGGENNGGEKKKDGKDKVDHKSEVKVGTYERD